VTKSSGTGSYLSFTWTATAESTASSAAWASAASYIVYFASGGTVGYDTDLNIPVTFSASDFSSAFANGTGYSLSYVTFTPPASTSGKLYYNYDISTGKGTSVGSSAKYYVNSSPNLAYITFVPADDYTGAVKHNLQGISLQRDLCGREADDHRFKQQRGDP
jgi:hypothetical protein